MENTILFMTLILGLILGTIMLCVVLFVYVKKQTFGFGGSILTTFGVLLLGLSLWKSVEVSVTPDGGIQAKFQALEQRIKQDAKKTSERIDTLTKVTTESIAKREFEALVKVDDSLPDDIGAVCTTSKLLYKNLFVMSSNRHRAISVKASKEFPCKTPDTSKELLKINKKFAEYLYGVVPDTELTSAIIGLVD